MPMVKHSILNASIRLLRSLSVPYSEVSKKEKILETAIVFISAFIVRMLIYYKGYWNESLRTNSLKLDIVRHSYFIQQTFQGNLGRYVLPSGEVVNYSPVTPIILSLIVIIPHFILSFSWYHSTLIAGAILMSIETTAIYVILRKMEGTIITAYVLSVFNPFELLDVMTWGGLSLILTSTMIAWIILIYLSIISSDSKKEKIEYWILIGVLALISAFAHRTGFLIQVLTFIVFLYKYRNYVIKFKMKKQHYLGILAFLIIITIAFFKIRKIHLDSLSNSYNLNPTIEIKWETIPIALNMVSTWVPSIYGYWIIAMIFSGLLLYGIYVKKYWEEDPNVDVEKTNWHIEAGISHPIKNIIGYHLPRSYLIVTALLFLYPWNPGGIRARFLASVAVIYLSQICFLEKFLMLAFKNSKKVLILIVYYLGLIITSISSLLGSIDKIYWVINRYG